MQERLQGGNERVLPPPFEAAVRAGSDRSLSVGDEPKRKSSVGLVVC